MWLINKKTPIYPGDHLLHGRKNRSCYCHAFRFVRNISTDCLCMPPLTFPPAFNHRPHFIIITKYRLQQRYPYKQSPPPGHMVCRTIFTGGFSMAQQVKVSPRFRRLCNRFAAILGGEHEIDPGPVCFVSRLRNFRATILGRRTTSPLVRAQLFSFESLDRSGRALCLGETAVFQNQANRLIRNLQSHGITVTALHNHWLFERRRLMYIHWEAIQNPIVFARNTKRSIAFLG